MQELAVAVQVTFELPVLLAVIVKVAPASYPVTEIVGVVSEVMLSESELPESEPAARSRAVGAAGGAVSTTTVIVSELPLVFPAMSC